MLVINDYVEVKLIDSAENILIVRINHPKENITLQEIKENLQPLTNNIAGQIRWASPQGNPITIIDSAKLVHEESKIDELE